MACRISIVALLLVAGIQVIYGQGCDETYTEFTGTLTSPNYPSNYPLSTTCNYIIDTTGRSIRIEFQDVQIEPGYDFLYYGEGTTPDIENALGTITGITYPLPVDIGSGSMWFTFTSDDVDALTGFSLTWEASDEALPTTAPPATTPGPTTPSRDADPELDVQILCDGTSMTVTFNPAPLFPTVPDASEVHFSNDSCVGYEFGPDRIALTTNFNECDTKIEETTDHVIFRNRLLYGDALNPQLNGIVECRLARHLNAEAVVAPEADNVQFTQISYGNFTFNVDFYEDGLFGAPYQPEDYPLEVVIGDDMFVETSVVTQIPLDVHIEACWGTQTPDKDGDSYFLISSGCAKDDTVVFLPDGPQGTKRFSFGAFAFPTGAATFYVHCELLACDANTVDSTCKQGCVAREKRNSDISLEFHTVSSSGPITVRG